MPRWKKKAPTAQEKRHHQHTAQREACRAGRHALTATFRPGEQVCTACAVVFYCPVCLEQHQLPLPITPRAFALDCPTHRKVQVYV